MFCLVRVRNFSSKRECMHIAWFPIKFIVSSIEWNLWITFYIKLYVCHWYRLIRFVIDTDLYVLSLIQTYTFCHLYRLIRFVIDTDLKYSFTRQVYDKCFVWYACVISVLKESVCILLDFLLSLLYHQLNEIYVSVSMTKRISLYKWQNV
jgi:hypothetical protein